MKTVQLLARILILLALQILLFNRLVLFDYGFIFLYLYAVLTLPLSWKSWQVLLTSFAMGLIIDVFAGTYGLHMISATFIGFIRFPVLRLFVRDLDNQQGDVQPIQSISATSFLLYALVCTVIFCIVFFFVDYFSLVSLQRLSITVGISGLITTICLLVFRILFAYKIDR